MRSYAGLTYSTRRVSPLDGPEHCVDAHQQRTQQLLTLAQALHFALGVHQRQQGGSSRARRIRRVGVVGVGESFSWTIGTILWTCRSIEQQSNKARQDGEVLFERGELQLSSVISRD